LSWHKSELSKDIASRPGLHNRRALSAHFGWYLRTYTASLTESVCILHRAWLQTLDFPKALDFDPVQSSRLNFADNERFAFTNNIFTFPQGCTQSFWLSFRLEQSQLSFRVWFLCSTEWFFRLRSNLFGQLSGGLFRWFFVQYSQQFA
jgi:hypothetical protein